MSDDCSVSKVPIAALGFLLSLGVLLAGGVFSTRALKSKMGTIGDYTWEYKEESNKEVTFYVYPTSETAETMRWAGDIPDWNKGDLYDYYARVTRVIIEKDKPVKVASTARMFEGFKNARSIDISGLHTEGVKDMSRMFYGCMALTSLDVSHVKTDDVTDMSDMFKDCRVLPFLNLESWNVEKVKNMKMLFYGCRLLKEIKGIDTWNTKSLTNMWGMFWSCNSVKELRLNTWDVSRCKNFHCLFAYCYALERLEVDGWNTSSATNFSFLFFCSPSLTKLDLSRWDTSHVTNFNHCFSVSSYERSEFPSKIENFLNLGKLRYLDISGWDMKSLQNRERPMQHFIFAPELSILKVSHKIRLNEDDDTLTYSGTKSGTHWQVVDETNGGTISVPKGQVFNNVSNSHDLKSFHASKADASGFETYVRVGSAQYFTFDKNSLGATGQMDPQVITVDTAENLKANSFTYAGHHFKEWNTKEDGTGRRYEAEQMCHPTGTEYKRPITLFAQWEPNHRATTFNSNVSENTASFRATK